MGRCGRSFAVLACGVDYLVAQHPSAGGAAPLTLPSLHVLGEADGYRAQGEALVGRYERPHVLRHAHGHELPLTLGAEAPELLRAVAEFVLSPSLVPAGSGPGLSMGSVLALLVPAGLVALYCRSWL